MTGGSDSQNVRIRCTVCTAPRGSGAAGVVVGVDALRSSRVHDCVEAPVRVGLGQAGMEVLLALGVVVAGAGKRRAAGVPNRQGPGQRPKR